MFVIYIVLLVKNMTVSFPEFGVAKILGESGKNI